MFQKINSFRKIILLNKLTLKKFVSRKMTQFIKKTRFLPESISSDLLLVVLLAFLCSSVTWSFSFACSQDSIFCLHSFGLVSSSGAESDGFVSDRGEGDEGLSRSEEKSAPRRAGLFLGPLPRAFRAQDRSNRNHFS